MKTYLKKSRFYYEEASWFDGQYWEKPLSVIKKDRFFLTQKKKKKKVPRLEKTEGVIGNKERVRFELTEPVEFI